MDYVKCVFERTIQIQCETKHLLTALGSLNGFAKLGENVFSVSYSTESELALQLSKLNNLGFLFVNAGPDMHPGGEFRYLREKGLVQGKIKTISWSGPNSPIFGNA